MFESKTIFVVWMPNREAGKDPVAFVDGSVAFPSRVGYRHQEGLGQARSEMVKPGQGEFCFLQVKGTSSFAYPEVIGKTTAMPGVTSPARLVWSRDEEGRLFAPVAVRINGMEVKLSVYLGDNQRISFSPNPGASQPWPEDPPIMGDETNCWIAWQTRNGNAFGYAFLAQHDQQEDLSVELVHDVAFIGGMRLFLDGEYEVEAYQEDNRIVIVCTPCRRE